MIKVSESESWTDLSACPTTILDLKTRVHSSETQTPSLRWVPNRVIPVELHDATVEATKHAAAAPECQVSTLLNGQGLKNLCRGLWGRRGCVHEQHVWEP